MILKSMSIKDPSAFGRLIDYVRRDDAILKGKDEVIRDIRHNVSGTSAEILKQFKDNEAERIHKRSNNVMLHHIVLSLSGEDEVTPEMLERLTREYISLMNQDALFYSTLHMDDKNPHSHTLMSGVAAGKSVRISREEFQQVKIDLENKVRELYPELLNSEVDHSKHEKNISDKEWQVEHRGEESKNREIREKVSASFELSTSRDEFYQLLGEEGLKTYSRNNEVVGIEDDYDYRFDTLNLDLSILDERENRTEQLIEAPQRFEVELNQELKSLTIEEQRLLELEELDN